VRVAGLQLNLSESPCDNKIYTYKLRLVLAIVYAVYARAEEATGN